LQASFVPTNTHCSKINAAQAELQVEPEGERGP
jgi:hypothetical protein